MKESSTYQAILGEGAVTEAKRVLRLQGDEAFGRPDAGTAAALDRINDLTHLEELLKRFRTVRSWQELLGQQTISRRGGRRRLSP